MVKAGQMKGASYKTLYESGELFERVTKLYSMLKECSLCPRECGVNRQAGELGVCKSGMRPVVASHNAHKGEEPPISGTKGSGTIFLAHCTLKCIFCHNYPISQLGNSTMVTVTAMADMMLNLQKRGCHNINFVTPTHYAPQIAHAVLIAAKNGLDIPLVYNTSGYESLRTLRLLDGIIDIYLPDMKYDDDEAAIKYSGVPRSGYKDANRQAVTEMIRQVGQLSVDDAGIAKRGVLIRHLVLPGKIAGSQRILKFISDNFGKGTYISLMSQYFPAHKAVDDPALCKRVGHREYKRIVKYMEGLGFGCGWTQSAD